MAKIIAIFDRRNTIQAHADYFPPGTPDVEWLRSLTARRPRPVVLCGDLNILSRAHEREALRSSGLTFVAFAKGWTCLEWSEYAWKFLKAWPAIATECRAVRHASIIEVSINGKVQRMKDTGAI